MSQATAGPTTSAMATEKTAAAVSQATPVSGRGISESESDSDGDDTAPVSYFY